MIVNRRITEALQKLVAHSDQSLNVEPLAAKIERALEATIIEVHRRAAQYVYHMIGEPTNPLQPEEIESIINDVAIAALEDDSHD